MTMSLAGFSRASVGVLALVYPGLASAQIWSSPKVVANGSAIAVSTNGTGRAGVMFTPMSAVVETGGTWGAPVVLSNLGPYGNGSGNLGRAEWRCAGSVELPHNQHLHPQHSAGCVLHGRALGEPDHDFEQRLWECF